MATFGDKKKKKISEAVKLYLREKQRASKIGLMMHAIRVVNEHSEKKEKHSVYDDHSSNKSDQKSEGRYGSTPGA